MKTPETRLQANLKRLMRERGIPSMAELSRRASMNETGVKAIMNGKSENPRGDTLRNLAAALDVSVDDLIGSAGADFLAADESRLLAIEVKRHVDPAVISSANLPNPNVRLAPDAPPFPAISLLPRDVPVFGTAQAGPDGAFEMNYLGGPVDYVRRAPGLLGMDNVFAIYVEGESMEPWRTPGQIVYVHRKRRPRVGDYVVVVVPQEAPGQPPVSYIKKLAKRTAAEIVVEQYNPPREMRFPNAEGVEVFRVIDWDEAMGL